MNSKKIKVDFLLRNRPEAFSIERIFTELKRVMSKDIFVSTKIVPVERSNIKGLIKNLFWCRVNCGKIIHITGDIHYCALAFWKRKVILTIHDLRMLHEAKGLRAFIFKKLWFQWPLKFCDIVTCISEKTKTDLLKTVNISEEKIVVIPNPISSEFIYKPKQFNKVKPQILHFNVTSNKNLITTIDAIDGLSCHLRIIGKITEEQQRVLEKNLIDYSWCENISDQEILDEYYNCDLLCFPSTLEGFGMPIIEAQAVGRAVVSSNISPMKEVANGAASLVDPLNAHEIREAIDKLIQNDKFRSQIINNGLKNIQQYKSEYIASEYAKLYIKLAMDKKCVK